MATYVVDASVVMHYLIADIHTTNAKAFFDAITDQDKLIVPEFCLMECANVLWKQVRFHSLPQTDADFLLRDLFRLPLTRTPVKRALPAALQIGLRHQLAIYDSVYISLAIQTGTPLLSVDQPQIRAATAESVKVIQLTQFVP